MWIRYTTRFLSLSVVLLLLAGCTSSWKAPLETRGGSYRQSSPSAEAPIRARFYKVQRGDTLYAIAWRANRDFRSLARWNNIKPPYVIHPGQILRLVPYGRTSGSVARAESSQPASKPKPKPKSTAGTAKTTRPPVQPKPSGPPDSQLRWAWPAEGPLLARFSASDPTRKGIKIGGRQGQPVYATGAGEVVYSGSGLIGYGRLIIIKHNDNYLSAYGHNDKLLVKEGEQVARGKQIATMGRSNEGKPMLHFEIRRDGKPVDPMGLLPGK